MQRGFRRLVPVLIGVLTVGILVIGAGAAGPSEKDDGLPVKRVVMFASDGMRPDLMEKYAKDGAMPTYKELMKDGITGDNGMTPAFPPNTGVGWYTMATGTYPSEHGSTNNTYFRGGRRVLEPHVVLGRGRRCRRTRSRTPPSAPARRSPQIDWVGGAAAGIAGPDRRLHQLLLEPRRARRRRPTPSEQAGSAFFGVDYEVATIVRRLRLG